MNTFSKKERLCSNKQIDALFSAGDSFIIYPLRVVYKIQETDKAGISILASVSKKKFKRAVKRNRVKRLIKEAYRLNKLGYINLSEELNSSINIAFLYLKNELPSYEEIETAIQKTTGILKEKTIRQNKE